jgi:hypothetical protein
MDSRCGARTVNHQHTAFIENLSGKEYQTMARCEVCGNDYDKSLTITADGKQHVFDSFECAIHALAPRCAHCKYRVIGHGVEAAGRIYCCTNCARQAGVTTIADRAA